ncbi:CLUMA_CG006848, isoform A [Clunio marinus]|uniref:CLUMA_CG006848, isoform A n=1 Tax=Clunio marinus TaxID=568069 RepID=A0A1J1I4J5_9DIPT|nr:CLUMA_CG006848, isoform A [Clunio marinus]
MAKRQTEQNADDNDDDDDDDNWANLFVSFFRHRNTHAVCNMEIETTMWKIFVQQKNKEEAQAA